MELEGPVRDELGVKTAVKGAVDFLGHEAVEERAGLGANLIEMNIERDRRSGLRGGGQNEAATTKENRRALAKRERILSPDSYPFE